MVYIEGSPSVDVVEVSDPKVDSVPSEMVSGARGSDPTSLNGGEAGKEESQVGNPRRTASLRMALFVALLRSICRPLSLT